MIRYLIKNYCKLMLRNGTNLIIYILGPIIVSAVVGSAFTSLLENYQGADDFKAGYSIEDDSKLELYVEVLKEVADENGIHLVEYSSGSPEDHIKEDDLGGFVEIKEDSYKVYESGDAKIEGSSLEYLMTAFFSSTISGDTSDIKINVKEPGFEKTIESKDYYGIVYIVYYGWVAILCAAGILSNEKKYKISERIGVSNLSTTKMYIAKHISLVIAVTVTLGISAVLEALLLDVHYGNILITSAILFATILASSAFGLMIYELTRSTVASVIIAFSVSWTMGFIGGCFETYMFSSHPQSLKNMDPVYYTNRALAELSNLGHSDYVVSSIVISLVIAAVCSLGAIAISNVRRAGR